MIYMMHFDKPFKHAKHYVGYTTNFEKRLERHRKGGGSRLLRAVGESGIKYHVVKTWHGDRSIERRIKNQKNAPRFCPICKHIVSNSHQHNRIKVRNSKRVIALRKTRPPVFQQWLDKREKKLPKKYRIRIVNNKIIMPAVSAD
jgi:predicted GIY-YIG superfamily endonuclease